jgi:hypothetical protein
MDMLDILAGYTFDIISAFFVYVFKYKAEKSFNEIWEEDKKLIRNITYVQIVVLLMVVSVFLIFK